MAANVLPEYEINVQPSGVWNIYMLHLDRRHRVAYGAAKGPDCMAVAERDAREWVGRRIEAVRASQEYKKRCKIFRLPAYVRSDTLDGSVGPAIPTETL